MTTELEAKAAEAWKQMARPRTIFDTIGGTEPFPPAYALDFCQDVCGERDDAVTALLTAAANWLRELIPDDPCPSASPQVADALAACGEIPGEDFGHAEVWVANVAENARRVEEAYVVLQRGGFSWDDYMRASAWRRWADHATRAIELCRAVPPEAYPVTGEVS